MKTHFIDTNYFLRFLLKDNEKQFKVVFQLFEDTILEKTQVTTNIIVIFEIFWVLSSFYKQNKEEVIIKLQKIVQIPNIQIENREILSEALTLYSRTKLDFEDCYNICTAVKQKVDEFSSFDKDAVKEFSNTNIQLKELNKPK
jgi:predicted nucleic-acid-binding protein